MISIPYLLAEHVVVYWTLALLMTPRDIVVPWNRESVSRVFFNQLVINTSIMAVWPWWPTHESSGESLLYFGTSLICVLAIEELWFYWCHRILHLSWFYSSIHKIHHRWVSTMPWAAIDAHPIEHALCNFIPVIIGPTLVGWSLSLWRIWLTIATLSTIRAHRFQEKPTGRHHVHHIRLNGNYGVCGLTDQIFGTLIE